MNCLLLYLAEPPDQTVESPVYGPKDPPIAGVPTDF